MKLWEPDELATLARVYPGATWPGIHNALPGRTSHAVRHKANDHNIKRQRVLKVSWTGAQLMQLRKLYPRAPWPKLLNALAPHTRMAITRKASELRLFRPARKRRRRAHPLIEALRTRRRALGWSQPELARRIGVHPVNLQTWEGATAMPRLRLFFDWVEALGVELYLKDV